jgi:uncharacterized BrkB/YihY/UPF0761 family membrane protein
MVTSALPAVACMTGYNISHRHPLQTHAILKISHTLTQKEFTMEQPQRHNGPDMGNHLTYWSIIGMTLLLCFAWLLTGSVVLTLIIIVLGLLHLAQFFPDAEEIVRADPILLTIRRFSLLLVILITAMALLIRYIRL